MFLTGRDCLTLEKVPDWVRMAALASFFSPIGFARYTDEAAEAARIARAAGSTELTKIERQMATRGWTVQKIEEAIQSGEQIRATNRANGNPATRYVHPTTGQSVVVDDVTGNVIHVGGPGFKYGPESGDLP
jgi:hypothetical protein